MNTIWLKMVGVAVVIVVAIVAVGKFKSGKPAPVGQPQGESKPADKPKTFGDMAERDKQFGEIPQPEEPQPAPPTGAETVAPVPTPAPTPVPDQPPTGVILPSQITRPTILYFKPMDEIDDIEAQRILPVATAGRSIGRLPVTHFNLMVQGCRQILERWPDSVYAFRAKQMLEDLPERFYRTYKITEQDLDISQFTQQRKGTQPVTVEPKR